MNKKRNISDDNIHFRTTKKMKEKTRKEAKKLGLSMSEYIEQAIAEKINKEKSSSIKVIDENTIKMIKESNAAWKVWSFRRNHEVTEACENLFDSIEREGRNIWDQIL